MKEKIRERRVNIIVVFVFMSIIMKIFAESYYWPDPVLSKRKLLELFIIISGIVLVPLSVVLNDAFNNKINEIKAWIKEMVVKVRNNKKYVAIYMLIILLIPIIAYIAASSIGPSKRVSFFVFCTIGYILVTVLALRKSAAQKTERLFAIVALLLGGCFIMVTPAISGLSWDDQIHYDRAANVAGYLNGIKYDSEHWMTEVINENVALYDPEVRAAHQESLNTRFENKEISMKYEYEGEIWAIAYVPIAIGMILGRGLGLSFIEIFVVGKLFNILAYVAIMYFAIKRLCYGKTFMSIVGLIPTSLYMAGSYSYDPWVIAFVMLGFSYFFYEIQTPDKKLENKNIVIMLAAILLGCLPKAVYCPLLLPLLFMPRKKFKSKKQQMLYYAGILFVGVALVLSFVLPMFLGSTKYTDTRGGADVNSGGQIKYILNNPAQYMGTLATFLMDYINPQNSWGYLTHFAYIGIGRYNMLLFWTLLVVAFLDRSPKANKILPVRVTTVIGVCVGIMTVATSMYVSFTAVGSNTIEGCQSRYLLPMVFPLIYSFGIDGIKVKINANVITIIGISIMSGVFLYNIGTFCTKFY